MNMAGSHALECYKSAISLRRELARIIENSTDTIAVAMERAIRRLSAQAPGGDPASAPDLEEAGRQLLRALPDLLRARSGSRRAETAWDDRPRLPGAGLSAALRYRLHTIVGQAVWDVVAAQAPQDWTPAVTTRLHHDMGAALAHALGGTVDHCVAELTAELCRRRREHMDFCVQMLQEHEQQRDRFAEQVHDVIAQDLAAARYHANVAHRVLPRDTSAAAREALEAQRLIEHALAQIRRVVIELRPPALDRFGLRAAIKDYLARLERDDGVDATFHGNGDMPQLAPLTQSVLFRTMQDVFRDLLLPVGATEASVRLHLQDDGANLVIAQEGELEGDGEEVRAKMKALTTRQVQSRLAKLQARLELVGGSVHSRLRAGHPVRIEIRVPVENGGV